MIRRPPRSTRTDTLFPYTTLCRSALDKKRRFSMSAYTVSRLALDAGVSVHIVRDYLLRGLLRPVACTPGGYGLLDRKSTRLNSITNAHLVCRLLPEKKNDTPHTNSNPTLESKHAHDHVAQRH